MKRTLWLGFILLCVGSGSRWVLATYFPSDLPPLLEQGLHESMIGVLAAFAGWKLENQASHPAEWLKVSSYFVLLMALPALVAYFARGGVSGISGLALLTLTPAVAALILAQQMDGFGAGEGFRGLLLPALAAVGGAFLLIPVAMPSSLTGQVWLVLLGASVVPVALACVRLHRLLQQVSLLRGIAIGFSSSGLICLGFSLVGSPAPWAISWSGHTAAREILFCLLIDAPLAWLTVWLLREVEPVRYTSRYLFVPLISILEGMLIERPGWTWTTLCGLALMAGGAGYLVSGRGRDAADGLKLR